MSPKDILLGLGVVLLIGVIVSPYASSLPDGLSWVANNHNFANLEKEDGNHFPSVLADYRVPGLKNRRVSVGIAGGVGILIVFGGGLFLGKLLKKKAAGRG